jgi:hypothetical protein
LEHLDSKKVLSFPKWEWADFDRNKLYWATGGKLFSRRLNSNGLFGEKELQDFTSMKFDAIQAPY